MNRATPLLATAYLAADGFVEDLRAELGEVMAAYDRLLVSPGPAREAAFAQNVWYDPVEIPIASVSDGVRALRAIQRNWALYSHTLHRRAALIQDGLPKVSAKPLGFGEPAPSARLGSWTLTGAGTILAAPLCSSPFANGEARFVEDKQGPPNRAYLKLWEAFTLLGRRPAPGQLCLDLGGSPGGWAFVLASLGARVISVDKAPLDPAVAALPGVSSQPGSAFALDPASFGPVDWLFSDVICYPERLIALIERWLSAGTCENFVCTVKFQGATDFAAIARLKDIPGSRLIHLYHNKHELTWIRLAARD